MAVNVHELYWAAGFLEGEGSFIGSKKSAFQVTACQVQKQPLERLVKLFGGTLFWREPGNLRQHAIWRWVRCGKYAAGIMMTLYSLLSPRRQEQAKSALTHWKSLKIKDRELCRKGHEYKTVGVYIAPAGWRTCRECKRASQHKYMQSH